MELSTQLWGSKQPDVVILRGLRPQHKPLLCIWKPRLAKGKTCSHRKKTAEFLSRESLLWFGPSKYASFWCLDPLGVWQSMSTSLGNPRDKIPS